MNEDKARLERKINKYVNYSSGMNRGEQSSASSYTSEKIKNLHKFLENVDSESMFSESEYDGSTQQFANRYSSLNTPVIQQSRDQQQKRQQLQQTKQMGRGELSDEEDSDSSNGERGEGHQRLRIIQADLDQVKQQLNEAKNEIEELKDKHQQEYRAWAEQEKATQVNYDVRVQDIKSSLEQVIERHLKFIDQLILDKKDLNAQVEHLSEQMRGSGEKQAAQLREVKDKFTKELKANKEAWMSAEKIRKEKWSSEKTQEIKEVTIKGFEPEIERMINRHKLEVKKIEERHVRALSEVQAEATEEAEKKFRQYREKVLLEADEMIQNERSYKTDKLKDQLARLEAGHLEERSQLKRTLEQRIFELESSRREESEIALRRLREVEEKHIEEIRELKFSHNQQMEDLRYESQSFLGRQKEQLRIEQDKWMEKHLTKSQEELAKRTLEMRRRLEKERDQQIEAVIAKMADESLAHENQVTQKLQPKIAAVHADYANQIKLLQKQITSYQEEASRSITSKNQVQNTIQTIEKQLQAETLARRECENQKADLLSQLEDFQRKINLAQAQSKEQNEETKAAFAIQTEKLQQEVMILNKTLQSMDEDRLAELEAAEERHTASLHELEERVRGVILKKDTQITRLKEEVKYKEATCAKMQQLLDKQRTDLVNKLNQ